MNSNQFRLPRGPYTLKLKGPFEMNVNQKAHRTVEGSEPLL